MSRLYEGFLRSGGALAQDAQPGTALDGSETGEAIPVSAEASSDLPGRASGLENLPCEEVDPKRLHRVAFITEPHGPAADRFRFLRLRLLESQKQKSRRRLLVTSPLPQDGKSTISINLATALADGGKRSTLLIDADLHHATISEQLGFESRPGLAECLEAGLDPMSAVIRLGPLACYFLPAGKADCNPAELLQSCELSSVIAALSAEFEWTVMDAPPVAPFTDALSLKKESDGSLLVVRAGQTPSDAVENAMSLLGREHVLGIVLNGVDGLERMYSKYSKYYKSKR